MRCQLTNLQRFVVIGLSFSKIEMKQFSIICFVIFCSFKVVNAKAQFPPDPSVKPPVYVPQFTAATLDDFSEPDEGGEVFFVDESLDQVLRLFGELTNKIILTPESLPKPVFNFDSQGKITKQEAIIVIESLLSMNGIAVAEMGDRFLRIIPSGTLKNKSPDMINSSVERLSPSEKMYSKLFRVKYMKWEDVNQLVNNRLSPNGAGVELYESSKSFILTDTLVNLQRVDSLLTELDVPSEKEIMVRKLTYILAGDLKTKLETSMQESFRGFVQGSVSIQADERTNQIIIATDKDNVEMFEKLIQTYDVDSDPITASKVIYIKHAESTVVVSLLETIINSQKNTSKNESRNVVSSESAVASATNDKYSLNCNLFVVS